MSEVKPKRLPPFKPKLRQAIRDGRKTMTRRVMKPQPELVDIGTMGFPGIPNLWWRWKGMDTRMMDTMIRHMLSNSPYGRPGDIRFLIEPLEKIRVLDSGEFATYQDDAAWVIDSDTQESMPWPEHWARSSSTSIHMPTVAARTFVRLTGVRVERVQEISDEDIQAEGVELASEGDYWRDAWIRLWDSINGTRNGGEYAWAANPYCWVIEWELLEVTL